MDQDQLPRAGEVDLRQALLVLRRHRLLILLVIVVAAGSSYGLSKLNSRVYEASATLLVEPRLGESLVTLNQRAVALETEILVIESQDALAEAVNERFGADVGRVDAQVVGTTSALEMTRRSTDPAFAAAVVNTYAEEYIDYRLETDLADLQSVADQLSAEIARLDARIDALDARLEVYGVFDGVVPEPAEGLDGSTVNLPREATDLLEERAALLAERRSLEDRLATIRLDASLRSSGAELIRPATVPASPVAPRAFRTGVVGLLAGVLAGIGYAFVVHQLSDGIRTKDDLELAAAGVPVVGVLPLVPKSRRERSELLSLTSPRSTAAESMRSIRTSLQVITLDESVRTVQITSPLPGDGKTTVTANLGIALAQVGRRVLIVDADMRRPRQHKVFGVQNRAGLCDVLIGNRRVEDVIVTAANAELIDMIPSGPVPGNPAELLAGPRFVEVLDRLRDRYDIVLVDTPPVLPVADARIIASKVDTSVLVVAADNCSGAAVADAVEQLGLVGCRLSAAVLNQALAIDGYGYGLRYRYGWYRRYRYGYGGYYGGSYESSKADRDAAAEVRR